MALADPQTITINTVAKTLNRTKPGSNQSIYATDDGVFRFTVSHQETKGGRTRHMVRLDNQVVAADPLTSVNEYKEAGVYLVIDQPAFGFEDAVLNYNVQGLCDWLTGANVLKVLADQH